MRHIQVVVVCFVPGLDRQAMRHVRPAVVQIVSALVPVVPESTTGLVRVLSVVASIPYLLVHSCAQIPLMPT